MRPLFTPVIIGICLIFQVAFSVPFPCSVYNASVTVSQADVILNIDYTYGNNIISSSTGQAINSNLRSIDALSNLCTCSSLHTSDRTVSPHDVTSLRVVNQQINVSHLASKPFDCLTGLTAVDLSGNSFPNGIDDAILLNQPALANLYLDDCNISSIPSSLFNSLSNLQTLSLRSNRFRTLPTDFLSNNRLGLLILDDNLQLQSIPKSIVVSSPSITLSLFRTPSLSCVPAVSNLIPANTVANCSEVTSSDKVYSGTSLSTQRISMQFSSVWDDDSLVTYLGDFLNDISIALSLDSSRMINAKTYTDFGRTTVMFNVLPRTREGQLASESVARLIKQQLGTSRAFSLLKQGKVTGWLTALAKIESSYEELAYCPKMGTFTSIISCNDPTDDNRWLDFTSPVLLALLAGVSAGLISIIQIVVIRALRKRYPKKKPTMLLVPTTAEQNMMNNGFQMNQVRAVSAMPFSIPDPQNPHYLQERAQSAQPVVQYQTAAPIPRMDDRKPTDQTDQQRSPSEIKPKPRKKTKKWDADRLANPWIAKEEDQSDDDNEFW